MHMTEIVPATATGIGAHFGGVAIVMALKLRVSMISAVCDHRGSDDMDRGVLNVCRLEPAHVV